MTNASQDPEHQAIEAQQPFDTGTPRSSMMPLPDDWNYEMTVETIEEIIDRIEMGKMGLADIFDQFAIAVEQLQQCESFLNHHRQQVDVLIETLTDD